ncbi:MAG: hypothetical protein WEE50_00290 [Chloroflexota bacterium]
MPSRSSLARVARSIAGRPDVDSQPLEITRSIGVVFVHGIGTQSPRETLLNWANPIVEMLAEWRRERDETSSRQVPIGEDPVESAGVEQLGGLEERAWVRLAIPATDETHPATTWLLTEAHWAGRIRAPAFGQAMRYLQSHVAAIVKGITAGYGLREERRERRLEMIIREEPAPWDERTTREIADLRRSASRSWRWIDWLDRIWQYQVVRSILSVTATVLSVLALAVYAPLRAVPIKAIRERAEVASLDAQLVSAFGDLPVLLDDPVQAAIVRERLADTIRWVRDRGCEEIVLIAHSGGAIVSFSTLLDDAYRDLPVSKLITLGQGLALGWRLEQTTGPFVAGNPIRGDLGAARPGLRWVDFWASYDPAPAGPLTAVDDCPLVAVESVDDAAPPSPIQVESRPVTNLMHMGADHDGYWRNDEGFLVPLIRHIDDPRGDGRRSRFYGSRLDRAVRIERRRRRVGLLLGWRWLSFAAGVAAVVLALIPALTPRVSLADTGNGIAAVWSRVPGHELVSGTIDGFGAVVAIGLGAVGLQPVADGFGWLGPQILGALVPVLAAFAIYSRGVGSWKTADASERQQIRREQFGPSGRAWARSEATLLVGGLLAIVLAALGPPVEVMLAWLVAVAAAALLVRRT